MAKNKDCKKEKKNSNQNCPKGNKQNNMQNAEEK